MKVIESCDLQVLYQISLTVKTVPTVFPLLAEAQELPNCVYHVEPTPYVQSVLQTRGFLGTGTVYQRELNKISIYAADSVAEAIQNF